MYVNQAYETRCFNKREMGVWNLTEYLYKLKKVSIFTSSKPGLFPRETNFRT